MSYHSFDFRNCMIFGDGVLIYTLILYLVPMHDKCRYFFMCKGKWCSILTPFFFAPPLKLFIMSAYNLVIETVTYNYFFSKT